MPDFKTINQYGNLEGVIMSLVQLTMEEYDEIISQAISGNSYRIKKAIEKAKNEKVTIAFLGGSVTMGYTPEGMIRENYAEVFCRSFAEKYCNYGYNCMNTGVSGTGSMMGLAFTENKIRDTNPDIIFVEYAINNGLDKLQITSFESLIDKLLRFGSNPSVIPVIICNEELYTCSGYMELIARHYDLPVINIYHMMKICLERGSLEWRDYACDYSHPSVQGHKLIADCIIKLFDEIEAGASRYDSYSIPINSCFSREFSQFELWDHRYVKELERSAFTPSDANPFFPYGWTYGKKDNSNDFCITILCKSLFILYEQSNNMEYGEIEVWEEDKIIYSIDGYSIYGWNNPDIKLVIHEEEARLHKLVIKMCRGDANKEFLMLGFGVVK